MPRRPRLPLLAAAALAAAAACARAPKLEPLPVAALPAGAVPAVTIESAAADPPSCLSGTSGCKVKVTFQLTDRGTPITGANGPALQPNWTLAWLDVEPVSGLKAWRSMLFSATSQKAYCLPPGGPGTVGTCTAGSPSTATGDFLADRRQPGAESAGVLAELGGGRYTYTYVDALPTGHPLGATLRVGVYLRGVTVGTAVSATTFDFVPDGSPLQHYETVQDAACNACHGLLTMHGGRISGVKLCATCHSWLLVDPDTVDPAALDGGLAATKTLYPNPLELARFVHRIHRGKNLPTLYKASSASTWPPNYLSSVPATPWPASPFSAVPPSPFFVGRTGLTPMPAGAKYSVVGRNSAEFVFGATALRSELYQPTLAAADPTLSFMTLAEGVAYPQDLRNCEACHTPGAQDLAAIGTSASTAVAISRRTCSGCHPDVFFGDPNNLARITPDANHLAHTGGTQLDDGACKNCHVVLGGGVPKLYAPIAEIHRPLNDRVASGSPHWSRVTAQLVDVQNARAGASPTVTFKVFDRVGGLNPLNTTALEPASATSSPVPRGMASLGIVLSGPTSDYLTGNSVLRASPPLTSVPDASGNFTFTFATTLPASASGTWGISLEGRRRPATTAPAYAVATDTFTWPYTGESITEYTSNEVKFVDVASGTLTTDPTRARRTVVSQARCEKCHLELSLHGGTRHDVAHCLLCHAPDATDWDKRPRDTRTIADGGVVGSAMVLLNTPIDVAAATKRWGFATVDGIEERSIHLKVMVHRIHVGEHEGAASLEGIRPFAIYGNASATAAPRAIFFDDVRFPGVLANCETCHLKDTWTIEAIPPGAQKTTANEQGTVLHTATFNADGTVKTAATYSHTSSSELKRLPITATCLACHTSGAAVDHAAGKTVSGVETCPTCHGEDGPESVRRWHAVP